MAKRSLADDLMTKVAGCAGVVRVRYTGTIPGSGKKKVKIARNEKDIILTITEPDFPRRVITVDTKNVAMTGYQIQQYLGREGVQYTNV